MRKVLAYIVAISLFMSTCGRRKGDDDSDTSSSSSGVGVDVTGSIKNFTGSQAEMARWAVVFVERDTGIARVADIDVAGSYAISQLNTNLPQTVVLLDPQYRVGAVLSQPATTAGMIHQFFTLQGAVVPTMVHSGPTVGFADVSPLTFTPNVAADADFDGIPDGLDGAALQFRLTAERSSTDTDKDGTPNWQDPDIDGDGLINWIDSDDDGNGIIDIFDGDSNGDTIKDSIQTDGERYFPHGVQYAIVQVSQEVQADNSIQSSLVFTAKLRPDVAPKSVLVKGPAALLEGAQLTSVDPESGDTTLLPWDGTLADDGESEDGGKNDGVYARRVLLASDKTPKSQQMVFIQLEMEQNGKTYHMSFPHTFPQLKTGAISGAYTAASKEVALSGVPFEGIDNFVWSVHVFDDDGIKVFSSPPVAGNITTYTLPDNVLDASGTYTAVIVATSLDRVPSFPAWMIRSAAFNLQ